MKNADMPAMPIGWSGHWSAGLTKREAFAMRNMAALIGDADYLGTKEDAAQASIAWADALLAALEVQS